MPFLVVSSINQPQTSSQYFHFQVSLDYRLPASPMKLAKRVKFEATQKSTAKQKMKSVTKEGGMNHLTLITIMHLQN